MIHKLTCYLNFVSQFLSQKMSVDKKQIPELYLIPTDYYQPGIDSDRNPSKDGFEL